MHMTDVTVTKGEVMCIHTRRHIFLKVARRHWYGTVLNGAYMDVVISTPKDQLERFEVYMPQFELWTWPGGRRALVRAYSSSQNPRGWKSQ